MRTRRRTAVQLAALGLAGLGVLGVAGGHLASVRPAQAAEARQRDVLIGGVRWHGSLEAAKREAAKQNRPVVLLSLFGRLDQEFC